MHVYIEDIARHEGQPVTIKGWLTNRRSSGKLHFLQVRDGSGFIQAVMSKAAVGDEEHLAARDLAVDHAADLILALGHNDVNLDGLGLSEPPTAAHGLIPSLVGERPASERHPGAVLPVEPHSRDAGLGDDDAGRTVRERRKVLLFALYRHRAAHLDGIGDAVG